LKAHEIGPVISNSNLSIMLVQKQITTVSGN
jgi:hypothetical protein